MGKVFIKVSVDDKDAVRELAEKLTAALKRAQESKAKGHSAKPQQPGAGAPDNSGQ